MNIRVLASDGIGGNPDLTSVPFTPSAGDTVVVVFVIQEPNAASPTIVFNTPGYTWHTTAHHENTGGNAAPISAIWAYNVPAGTAHFTTTNLGFGALTYFVFAITGTNISIDQIGNALLLPTTGIAHISTPGNLAANNEVAIAFLSFGIAMTPNTPVAGYTSTPDQGNTDIAAYHLMAAYSSTAGPAGSPHTGGWDVVPVTGAQGNGMILTFSGSSGGAGLQPGFPRSAAIEEPSEGMQESNVTPPSMGTPN